MGFFFRDASRFAGSGAKRFVQTYTPAKTRDSEADIKAAIRKRWEDEGAEEFAADVPLSVTATFTITKPPSVPKKRHWPVKKPDLDNYMKLLLDALNKFAFPDDGQVVQIACGKCYGETPMIEVWIEEIEL